MQEAISLSKRFCKKIEILFDSSVFALFYAFLKISVKHTRAKYASLITDCTPKELTPHFSRNNSLT